MIKLESLYTQENAENGVWKTFTVPNTKETFKLKIAGADSFKYREIITKQNAAELAREPQGDSEFNSVEEIERRHKMRCEQILPLIIDWEGFDQEFSRKRCLNLLINAPFVLINVDKFAADRANFFTPH